MERTSNMCAMVVTLDVSKVSGWLNAAAPCRVWQGEGVERGGGMQGRGGLGGRVVEWRRRKPRAGREPAAEARWPARERT